MPSALIYISLLALVVSVASFWWSNIRVLNRLEAVFVYPRPDVGRHPFKEFGERLAFKVILINNGTRREALLRLTLGLRRADGAVVLLGAGLAPLTVAPGDMQIFGLDHPMADVKAALGPAPSAWTDLGFEFEMIMFGFVAHRFVRLGGIRNVQSSEPVPPVEIVLDKAHVHIDLTRVGA